MANSVSVVRPQSFRVRNVYASGIKGRPLRQYNGRLYLGLMVAGVVCGGVNF